MVLVFLVVCLSTSSLKSHQDVIFLYLGYLIRFIWFTDGWFESSRVWVVEGLDEMR